MTIPKDYLRETRSHFQPEPADDSTSPGRPSPG